MIRALLIAVAALYLFVLTLVTWTALFTVRVNHSLCAFRGELTTQRDDGIEFLQQHPKGIPGITAGVIQTRINSQSKTLEALRSLRCN